MPQNMTHQGVNDNGKHDVEYEGDSRVVYDKWKIDNYDPDSDGSGNDFDPAKEYGINRTKKVNVSVSDSKTYIARYDRDKQAVRLYNVDGSGEVGNNTTVNVDIAVEVRGNG